MKTVGQQHRLDILRSRRKARQQRMEGVLRRWRRPDTSGLHETLGTVFHALEVYEHGRIEIVSLIPPPVTVVVKPKKSIGNRLIDWLLGLS